jgi:hypothetical protein
MKFQNAAHTTAQSGRSTRVDTTVAMELAASCHPLVKSKARLTTTITASKRKGVTPLLRLGLIGLSLVGPPSQRFW